MLKNITQLEYIAGGKLYHFTCDIDAPLSTVKDALNKFIQYVCQIEDNVLTQQKAAEEEKAKAEQPIEETKIEPIEG